MILMPGDLPEVDTGSSGKVSSSSAIQEKFQYLGAVGFPEVVDEGRSANKSRVCRQGPLQIYCSVIKMTEEVKLYVIEALSNLWNILDSLWG